MVAALVATFLIVTKDDTSSAGEIFLEPVSFTGADPFSDSIDTHNDRTTSTTAPVIPTTAPADPDAESATRSVPGRWPGLYGGTRNAAECDPEQLVAFLDDNPEKARAWGGVLGVAPADIADYVDSLTPVILQRDTRVTNHGFRDGRATSLQSVLQAGTAVLVDRFGVPRVKCGCGNPLLEPERVPSTPRYTGERWPTFSPANVINVSVDVEVTNLVLVNVAGGDPFTRPTGTDGSEDGDIVVDDLCSLFPDDPSCSGPPDDEPELGTGDVQVTLRWHSTADLDLSVTDPTGAVVSFMSPTSPSGGSLDVDSNGGCGGTTSSPVENVFWPTGSAPDGEYRITIDYFDVCPGGEGPQAFEVTFLVGGDEATVTPAAFQRGASGRFEVVLAVQDGRSVVVDQSSGPRILGEVSGTLNPGEQATYSGGKGPGFGTPDTTEAAPTTEGDQPGDGTSSDCSQYEEGSMMRILCEHDPTAGPAEDPGSLPVPAD